MAEDSPSRARIAQAFDAAAAYDAYAVVQRQVAAWLAERIVAVAPPRPRVLEVGCGTGFLTQAAWPRLDRPEWLMTDIAPEMLARGRAQMPDLCARVMDGERPDLAGEAPFDLIVSSLAVQWFSDLEGGLQRLADALLPLVVLAIGLVAWWALPEQLGLLTRIAITALFSLIVTFANFDIVRVLTAGGPLNSTHIFGTWAFRVGIEGGDIPLGAAVSLFMVPILAVAATFILRDITKRGSEV